MPPSRRALAARSALFLHTVRSDYSPRCARMMFVVVRFPSVCCKRGVAILLLPPGFKRLFQKNRGSLLSWLRRLRISQPPAGDPAGARPSVRAPDEPAGRDGSFSSSALRRSRVGADGRPASDRRAHSPVGRPPGLTAAGGRGGDRPPRRTPTGIDRSPSGGHWSAVQMQRTIRFGCGVRCPAGVTPRHGDQP